MFVAIFLFVRFYGNFSLNHFESYTSYNEQLAKIRILSILSFLLFPLTEYYESIYLKLYPTDWAPVILVCVVSFVSLVLSFYKNISIPVANIIPQLSYTVVYSALAYKCIKGEATPVMAIETACLILFSKLIFNKLKSFFYFLLYLAGINIMLFYLIETSQTNADIYISATMQASLVVLAMYLLEGNSKKNVLFGNKILESSNLYVMISDHQANIIFINPFLTQLTGKQQNELLKDGWWKVLNQSQEEITRQKSLIYSTIHSNQSFTTENEMTDPSGKVIYIRWQNTVVDSKYLLSVGQDISERKAYENAIVDRQEKSNKYHSAAYKLTTSKNASGISLQEIIRETLKLAAETMGIGRLGMWEFQEDRLVCNNLFSSTDQSFSSGHVLLRVQYPHYFDAISNAKVINAPDALTHRETREFSAHYFPQNNILSLLDVPIFINGELKGVVCAEATGDIRNWDTEDVNFVKDIADFLSLSIEAQKRKELEDDYSYILDNAGDIIYTTDALGHFAYINKAATKILGYSAEWLKGKHFTEIIHPDYREKIALVYLKQFRSKTESTYTEFKVVNLDGSITWVGQNVKLLVDKSETAKVIGFQAVVRNITKQKETELALLESENNFRQINENINEVFYLYNVRDKKYDYISPNCKTILGVDQSFFYEGSNYTTSFVIEEDKGKMAELLSKVVEGDSYEIDFRVMINGAQKWIREKSFPIKNDKGVLIKSSGVCSDITEIKAREEQLSRLSLVAQKVSNGVIITNPKGEIEWSNDSFIQLTGYSLEELVGKRPIELLSGPNTDNTLKGEIVKNRLDNQSVEILQYTKTGSPIWLLVNNTSIRNQEGETSNYIEIITDITDRKALEEEYRYILNNAGDVIYTTDQNGYVKFLNESIAFILGYTQKDLLGKHFTEIIHPEDKKMIAAFYMRQFKELKETTYREFRVLNKNNQVIWVGQNVKLITDPVNPNNTTGFQAVLRNITKQKETELALVTSESNFRQINDTINDVFFLYNMIEKKYDYMSPNCIKVLGAPDSFFYNRESYTTNFIIEKDREEVLKAYDQVLNGGQYEIEFRIRVENEIRWINEKSYAIKDANGVVVKSSGVCIDVTQRKMQEKKLLRINKELSLYSEDLAINNLLKEQLIYTNNFEEITKVAFTTLRTKINGIARGTLLLVNEGSNGFESYFVDEGEVEKDTFEFRDIKSFDLLSQGKKYIEHDIDAATEISEHDKMRRKDNIRSYILLPINYSNRLIGVLGIEFQSTFELSKSQISILENFTSVLSVVVNKLILQKELTEKSEDVMASLNYAEIIQQSILPNINHHSDLLKNFMKLYMPRDVVSGDFYWIESVDDKLIVALGDCTGHGVPGAFLTLLGSNFLQRIAVENKITDPAEIMELLDYQLYTSLNKNRDGIIRDGMELGICTYDRKTHTLTFAGAGLFLMYYKDNEQFVINGSKRSIGDQGNSKIEFEETTIALNGSEKFYLFSDGYRDQLGGDKRKRFSRLKFFNLLHAVKNLPSFQQEYILRMEHNNHRGKYQQTDDITVIGFELKK